MSFPAAAAQMPRGHGEAWARGRRPRRGAGPDPVVALGPPRPGGRPGDTPLTPHVRRETGRDEPAHRGEHDASRFARLSDSPLCQRSLAADALSRRALSGRAGVDLAPRQFTHRIPPFPPRPRLALCLPLEASWEVAVLLFGPGGAVLRVETGQPSGHRAPAASRRRRGRRTPAGVARVSAPSVAPP